MKVTARPSFPMLVVFLFLVSASSASASGPWTLRRGEGYIGFSTVFTKFDTVKAFNGSDMQIGDVEFTNAAVPIEYGVSDKLTLTALLPYETSKHQGVPAAKLSGLTDARIGIRYAVADESAGRPFTVAAALELKTPLRNYPTYYLSSPGDHQTDIEIRLLIGRSHALGDWSAYGDVEAGYRVRMGAPPDDLIGYAEVGVVAPFRLSGRVFLLESDARGGVGLMSPRYMELAKQQGHDPFPYVGEDFTRAGFGVGYQVTPAIDVNAFWAKAIHVGNSALDRNFGVSLGYRF